MILAREAAVELRELEAVRRRTDARQLELLVELAAHYRVGYEDVMDVLVEGLRRYGGDGTPAASEFLALEVGALLGCTPGKACGVIADALDLRYRHEVLWDAVQRLELEAARACRAAHLCHVLSAEAAAWAGQQWLAKQSGLGWTAAFNLLEKLIIEADPAAAAEREAAALEARDVFFWRSRDGVAGISGSLDLLDAKYLESMIDQIADLLREQEPQAARGVMRAKALAALSSPAYALSLLQSAAQQSLPIAAPRSAEADGDGNPGVVAVEAAPKAAAVLAVTGDIGRGGIPAAAEDAEWGEGLQEPANPYPQEQPLEPAYLGWPRHRDIPPTNPPNVLIPDEWAQRASRAARLNPHTAGDDGTGAPGHVCGTIAVPVGKLLPRVVLNVHVNIDANGELSPAARVERAEYVTTVTLASLLDGRQVRVQPVIDLNHAPVEDGYAPSAVLRRAVGLAYDHDMFPYATGPVTTCDMDHTEAYRPGHRGQTRLDNLAPINRRAHRAKTAGIWRLRRVEALHWTSPLGFEYLVTPERTQLLPRAS